DPRVRPAPASGADPVTLCGRKKVLSNLKTDERGRKIHPGRKKSAYHLFSAGGRFLVGHEEIAFPDREKQNANEELAIPDEEKQNANEELAIPDEEKQNAREEIAFPDQQKQNPSEKVSVQPIVAVFVANSVSTRRASSNPALDCHDFTMSADCRSRSSHAGSTLAIGGDESL